MKSRPHALQLEEKLTQQWRPSATKNKINKLKEKVAAEGREAVVENK